MAENLCRGIPVAGVKGILDSAIIFEHRFAFTTQHRKLGMHFAHMADKPVEAVFKQLRYEKRYGFRGRLINAHDGDFRNGPHPVKLLQDTVEFFCALIGSGNSNEWKCIGQTQTLAVSFNESCQFAERSRFQRFTITH